MNPIARVRVSQVLEQVSLPSLTAYNMSSATKWIMAAVLLSSAAMAFANGNGMHYHGPESIVIQVYIYIISAILCDSNKTGVSDNVWLCN